MPPPASLLASPLFAIRETAESGRGIYASTSIQKGTLLFETNEIAAKVVYREYRKEACAQCFKYDRGRDWKLRNPLAGVAFCSQECYIAWHKDDVAHGSLQAVTLLAAEGLKIGKNPRSDDEDNVRPTKHEIAAAWDAAEDTAAQIRAARLSNKPSKVERRAVAQALAISPERDILGYLVSGILCTVLEPEMWADVLELADESAPYVSAEYLQMHIISYHHILACCPKELLDHVTAKTLKTLAEKSSHNVFNTWSQDLVTEDGTPAPGGSECLGYGLWPAASYFNHSCDPNVQKRRSGRTWQFWAERDIPAGQELCITYLGGDEWEMTRDERAARLKQNWGFDCACIRCRI